MRKVEFSNLGVTFYFTPAQSNIEVKKNNIPEKNNWPKHPTNIFKYSGYVSKFRLVDTSKLSGQVKNHKITLEVRYKLDRVQDENNNKLKLGIHNGKKWLTPTIKKKYEIDDRSKKWYGSWLVEVVLPADPMVAWGP